jgi:RNA recognition motif-containing protein
MDSVGGPDAKKARWSPTSFNGSTPSNGLTTPANSGTHPSNRDAFANYGYGPQASISQVFQPNSSPAFTPNALYSTPSLSINTAVNGQGMQMGAQMSPHTATGFVQQQQHTGQQGQVNGGSPYSAGAFGYGMLGMGLPSMGMLGGFPYSSQSGNYGQNFSQQHRLPSLNVNIPPTPGAYSPAALSAVISGAPNMTARTVYIGNLPATASVDELLNLVHFGPLESIRVLPEKSCVFLSFLDGQTAASFHADATIKKLSLHGQELKIGWGKPSPVPAQVQLAIQQSNASRNVYLGGLDEGMTEEMLRDELSRFGLIDQVKIVRDKNIGFVHFLSISVATKVVNTLPTEPAWAGKRVNYGKDRCAYIPKSQQAAAQAAQAAAAQSLVQSATLSPNSAAPFGAFGGPFSPYAAFSPDGMGLAASAGMQGLNRTVYLGNIHPETTTEDLCNAIRGGVLQSVRYMQDKHIAFVTFVDPAAAFTFFQVSSYQGLTLNNRRLKIGWGKNSGPLPPSLALAVHSGATRNVYIGNIEDFELFSEEKLKRDFGEYGDIELVNFLKEKNCAFVNFTNVSNAIKAIDGVKNKPDYTNLRIAHGKDRCANPPRSGPQGGARRTASGNTVSSAVPGANEIGEGVEEDVVGVVDGIGEENGVAGPGPEIPEMRVEAEHEVIKSELP